MWREQVSGENVLMNKINTKSFPGCRANRLKLFEFSFHRNQSRIITRGAVADSDGHETPTKCKDHWDQRADRSARSESMDPLKNKT